MTKPPFAQTCDKCTAHGILIPTREDPEIFKCTSCGQTTQVQDETQPYSNFTSLKDEVIEHKRQTGELPLLDDDIHDMTTKRTRRLISPDMLDDAQT